MSKAHIEAEFEESNICDALAANGWLYSGNAAVDPEWDPALALHKADALWWLAERYPEQYEHAVAETLTGTGRQQAEQQLLKRLAQVLDAKPVIDPKTFRERGGVAGRASHRVRLRGLWQADGEFRADGRVPAREPRADRVRGVVREEPAPGAARCEFDPTKGSTIDLVLLVNGIPVSTMELKTDHATGRERRQPVQAGPHADQEHAVAAAGALSPVHFVVSNQLVLATALKVPARGSSRSTRATTATQVALPARRAPPPTICGVRC